MLTIDNRSRKIATGNQVAKTVEAVENLTETANESAAEADTEAKIEIEIDSTGVEIVRRCRLSLDCPREASRYPERDQDRDCADQRFYGVMPEQPDHGDAG